MFLRILRYGSLFRYLSGELCDFINMYISIYFLSHVSPYQALINIKLHYIVRL